jgi:hypothetical protein
LGSELGRGKVKKGTGYFKWDQILLFAFAQANAIYTNALHCGRLRSFYKWSGDRGNLVLKIGDIHVAFILAMKF